MGYKPKRRNPRVLASGADVEWPVNGGLGNIRYSPLTQITRENVAQLKVAWTYDSKDAFKDSEMQSNPIIVDGILYATTPKLHVVAVNAATGQEVWNFDPAGGAASQINSTIGQCYRATHRWSSQ